MKTIELQFAMDGAGAGRTVEDAIAMIGDIAEYIDIVEVGTSFVLRYGMDAVRRIKDAFPDKKILADMKIMDGGYHHSAMGCRFGADIVTVLGCAGPETIQNAVSAAHDNGAEAMVDLICTGNRPELIAFCEACGADYLCVHTGVDAQQSGSNPYEGLKVVMGAVKGCKIAVAGGIGEDTVEAICALGPDVLVVGGAIHKREDYRQAAAAIRQGMDRAAAKL